LAFLCSVGTLAACGSDSATSPGDKSALTSTEAQQVAIALFTEIDNAWAKASSSKAALAPTASLATTPTTFNETINSTCSAGGSITGTVNGSIDFDGTGTGSESVSMSVKMAGCKLNTGQKTIAVDGNLTYSLGVSYLNAKQSSDFVWKGKGSFNWTGGSCVIDYGVTLTPQGRGSESGTFCGTNINYSF
jgi:autotransporter translocation and assembly factor TamB